MTFMPFKSPAPNSIVGAPPALTPPVLRVISVVKPPCYPIHPSIGPCIHHCRHPIHLNFCRVGGGGGGGRGDFETPSLEPLGLPEYARSQ